MENSTKKKYTRYTKKQVSTMRKALKTEEPRLVIAKRLSKEWGIPTSGVYQKLNVVANTKRKYTKRSPKTTNLTTVTKNSNNDSGVTLTSDLMYIVDLLKKPTKVVMYKDHVRYYYN